MVPQSRCIGGHEWVIDQDLEGGCDLFLGEVKLSLCLIN
jgi:hypothetical protein